MKAKQVRAEFQQVAQTYECVNCKKQITQFYGRWVNSGTCSRKCEQEHAVNVEKAMTNVEHLISRRRFTCT